MLNFLFGISICLNLIFITLILVLYKIYKKKKEFKEVLCDEKAFSDFFINNSGGFKL